MPPDTEQIVGNWDCAMLVRGNDPFGNFETPPLPTSDFDPIAVSFHEKAAKAINEVLYKDAAINDHKL
tara:strand:- start:355 stop:558 length:204 start_codon:yes stop_codon:yes gene_type:complete